MDIGQSLQDHKGQNPRAKQPEFDDKLLTWII